MEDLINLILWEQQRDKWIDYLIEPSYDSIAAFLVSQNLYRMQTLVISTPVS